MTASGAFVVAVALALSPARGLTHAWLLLGVAGVALLTLGLGLVARSPAALTVSIVLLGAEQAIRLTTGSSRVDPWSPLYAAGFLLAAELAWWSVEPRVPAWAEYETALSRVGAIVSACIGGSVLAALVVLAAGAPLRGGAALELLGVAAAIAALVVVAVLARSADVPDRHGQ